jgi:hypothetical protein
MFSLTISTSLIATVNFFFKVFIKLSTNISGAEAPDEIPTVL